MSAPNLARGGATGDLFANLVPSASAPRRIYGDADIEGAYRYRLRRWWGSSTAPVGPWAFVCMVNSSTATGERPDPTIDALNRIIAGWGAEQGGPFVGYVVCNLAAWRSPEVKDLATAPDPIGPRNDTAIDAALAETTVTIAAWGARAKFAKALGEREAAVLARLRAVRDVHAFDHRMLKCGSPPHPLYTPTKTGIVLYRGRGAT